MKLLRQNTAIVIPIGPFLDNIDNFTPETALTVTSAEVRLRKNGGTWGAKNSATALSHGEFGHYELTLNATDTNTLGPMRIAVTEAGAGPVWEDWLVVPQPVYDALVAGSSNLPVAVASVATGAITNAALATDAISAGKVATSARTAIAGQVWEELLSAHNGAGSFGASVRVTADGLTTDAITEIQDGLARDADLDTVAGIVLSLDGRIPAALVGGRMDVARHLFAGVANGGTTTTLVSAGLVQTAADYWVGTWIYIRDPGGGPMGWVRLVTGFNPGTDTVTFTPAIPVAPVNGQVFEILPAASVPVGALGVGSIPVGAFVDGAITAAAIDPGAVTKIRAVASGQATSGTTTTIVDPTRVEPLTDHWKGDWIHFKSGTLAGVVRKITGFDPATDTITFAPALPTAATTQAYDILPSGDGTNVTVAPGGFPVGGFANGAVDNNALGANAISAPKIANGAFTSSKWLGEAFPASVFSDAAIAKIQNGLITSGALATVQSTVDSILGRLPTSLAGGRIRALVEAMDPNTLTSDALATSAVTEIASAVGGGGGGGGDPETIAAAVWDLPRVGHAVVGSFGEGVSAVKGNVDGSVGSVAGLVGGIAAGGIAAGSIAASAANKIADHVLRRAYGAARSGPDGDTYSARSILGFIAPYVNRWRNQGNTQQVFHEDNATIAYTRTLTPAPGSDPVSGASTD